MCSSREGRRPVKSKEFTIPSDIAQLHDAIGLLEAFGREAGIGWETCRSVALALDEVLVNIMRYAYEDEGEVHVRFEHGEGRLGIEVTDCGRPFDPTRAEAADPDDLAERGVESGRGLLLARSSVDELNYRRIDDENHLTLVKYLGG